MTADPEIMPSLARNRDFLLFLLCRTATVTGFQILSVAVGWHVYALSGEVLHLGLIGLFMFLPFLVFFLPAGMAADRFDRRHILTACNLVHTITIVSIGLWLASGHENVWPVFGLLLLDGSAQAFLHPALQATLPGIVPRQVFGKAVAATSSMTKVAQLAGPALGGLLIVGLDTGVYFVAAFLFLIAAVAALMMQASLRIASPERPGLKTIFGGIEHIRKTPLVLAAMSMDLVAVFFGGVMGLLPVFATDILHVGAEGLGLMRSSPAIGALAVGMFLARFGLPWHMGRAFFGSVAVFGLAIAVFAMSHWFILSVLALMIYGASDMVSVYIRQSLVQLWTPDHLRGRVSAVNSLSINASNQMGDFRAGVMASLIGAPAAVLLGAGVTLGCAALWHRFFPELRRLDRA